MAVDVLVLGVAVPGVLALGVVGVLRAVERLLSSTLAAAGSLVVRASVGDGVSGFVEPGPENDSLAGLVSVGSVDWSEVRLPDLEDDPGWPLLEPDLAGEEL